MIFLPLTLHLLVDVLDLSWPRYVSSCAGSPDGEIRQTRPSHGSEVVLLLMGLIGQPSTTES